MKIQCSASFKEQPGIQITSRRLHQPPKTPSVNALSQREFLKGRGMENSRQPFEGRLHPLVELGDFLFYVAH